MSDTADATEPTEEPEATDPVAPVETPPSALDEVFDEAPPKETPGETDPKEPAKEGETDPDEKKEGEEEKEGEAGEEGKEGDPPEGEGEVKDPEAPEGDPATEERLKATHTKLQEMGDAVRSLEVENRRLQRQAEGKDPDELTEAEILRENWLRKADDSEKLVKPIFSDYDDVVGTPGSGKPSALALEADPSLRNRVLSAANPAMEIYNIGQEFLTQQKYGKTPEEMRAKIREEVKAELAKEAKEKDNKKRKQAPGKKAGVPEATTLRDVETSSDSGSEKAIAPKSALDEVFPE